MTEKHPCQYGEDHNDGVANCIVYYPDQGNAIDPAMGTWVIETNGGDAVMQADYCPACGKKLPLAPRGEPLPGMEVEEDD